MTSSLPESLPMLVQTICSALEHAINQALTLNSGDATPLQALNQKTFTLELAELGFPLSITICLQKALVTTLTSNSDCTLVTSFSSLMALKNEQALTQLIKNDQLDISGDIKVAQQFAKLAESLHIDWQSELARHIGDIATYKLVQAGKYIKQKAAFAKSQIESDMSEWLVHEQGLAITKDAINHFSIGVDAAKQQVEQLSERIAVLTQKLSANNTGA